MNTKNLDKLIKHVELLLEMHKDEPEVIKLLEILELLKDKKLEEIAKIVNNAY